MKTILLLLLACCAAVSAQNTVPASRTQNGFSLSPISRKVARVNGLVAGIGHFRSELIEKQTVNGMNAELSPLGISGVITFTAALLSVGRSHTVWDTIIPAMPKTCTQINGLNLSTGGFLEGGAVNGLNISTFTIMNSMKGLSVSPGCLITYELHGVNVSLLSAAKEMRGASIGFCNLSENMKGLQIGGFNHVKSFSGLQLGLCNFSDVRSKGLQLGLVNRSKKGGLQIGLINVNSKRILPLINW